MEPAPHELKVNLCGAWSREVTLVNRGFVFRLSTFARQDYRIRNLYCQGAFFFEAVLIGVTLRMAKINHSVRKALLGAAVFFGTCVIAVIGYCIAGWSPLDAVYMVVITMFGVGYGEVRPIEDPALKMFTIAIILVGCSSTIFFAGGFLQMITEGEISRAMGEHRLTRDVEHLNQHTIICGYGRMGRILAMELHQSGIPFVVIERDASRVQEVEEGHLVLQGDAEDEDVLRRARIEHASTLATVLPDDAINVFVTLTARDLNNQLNIIARGEYPRTERKLLSSGATSVVMPAAIGAERIANLISDQSPVGT